MDNPQTLVQLLVLEFFFRMATNNGVLAALLEQIPIPNSIPPCLLETILIRCLTFLPPSGRTLTSLLYLFTYHPDSHLLKSAFSSVSVFLWAKSVDRNPSTCHVKFLYRLWSRRISKIERSGSAGLVTDALRKELKTLKKATKFKVTRDRLRSKHAGEEAVGLLKLFEAEAIGKLGPTALQAAMEAADGIMDLPCSVQPGAHTDRAIVKRILDDVLRSFGPPVASPLISKTQSAGRQPWTAEEESELTRAVTEVGPGKWSWLAQHNPTFQRRTAGSLRSKWKQLSRRVD